MKSGDLVKCLWHDGVCVSLYAKRLKRGRFQWPMTSGGAVSISAAQLGCLSVRIDWRDRISAVLFDHRHDRRSEGALVRRSLEAVHPGRQKERTILSCLPVAGGAIPTSPRPLT